VLEIAYGKSKRETESLQAFTQMIESGVKLEPDNSSVHFQLGQAYLKAGQREKGNEEINEAGRLQAQPRKKQEDRASGIVPASVVSGENP
jgi:Flp pilus assembly protein TadD